MEIELGEWLTIAAIISGPLSVFFLEKWWRCREWKRRRKEEVVYNLVGARGGTRTTLNAADMEKALNSIPVIFSDNAKITEAYREFQEEKSRQTSEPNLETGKLVELILTVCREMEFEEIEESTIKNTLSLHQEKFS